MTTNNSSPHVAIIGAGFCGLAAGYELSKSGVNVTIFEGESEIGGLSSTFRINGTRLEKFYHHWFNNDEHVMALIDELGTQDQVLFRSTRTGMYCANNFFKLSTPLDLLRFKPLSLFDRFRLGLLALHARRVTNWRQLENLTASEWLMQIGGEKVYKVVWEPLLRGKFGEYAPEVSAVWIWNKLKLRGGSRGKGGEEQLVYYREGFAAFANRITSQIESNGGRIFVDSPVHSLLVKDGKVTEIQAAGDKFKVDAIIATPALPIIADLVEPYVSQEYIKQLRRIKYLGNVCLILELDRSLSDIYWLNVNELDFPFVGIIEHTNFEPPDTYGGRHIVYLSKYLPASAELFRMKDDELLKFTIPHLQRMFPKFKNEWILAYHVWRAHYSQPVIERNYSRLLPSHETPLQNFFIATMAQIYPEDRGTNYAIREGRKLGAHIALTLLNK
jgi:protoporphyrinogen oxidase